MPEAPRIMTKRLPTLDEWLGEGRAEGFEEWVSLSLDKNLAHPEDAKFLRIAQTFGIACVEQMRREAEINSDPKAVAQALAMWARAAGFATMAAAVGAFRDDVPFRRIARIFSEDFKTGAKMAADSLARQQGASDQGGSDAAR